MSLSIETQFLTSSALSVRPGKATDPTKLQAPIDLPYKKRAILVSPASGEETTGYLEFICATFTMPLAMTK